MPTYLWCAGWQEEPPIATLALLKAFGHRSWNLARHIDGSDPTRRQLVQTCATQPRSLTERRPNTWAWMSAGNASSSPPDPRRFDLLGSLLTLLADLLAARRSRITAAAVLDAA